MVGNKTVDAGQCKPETLLYSSDECNKAPCGEGKANVLSLKCFLSNYSLLFTKSTAFEVVWFTKWEIVF